ncbi:MAG: superoxide dismutase [Alphaproteobacteria bacterium RIFCSPLOWO2_01_FULL_45_8]|nr:MAG: superoxide dismutase [Alphaproteobacteria bacterium GWB1_45_5]OFW76594.1 MAG: superoxide dismutase [Alphaproteobacteria bacterium GWA1_45_9]OFW89678.1 MAG: superoxide dismutase [Alphaproteobacteria bacterium RIFCSPHIGHO2_01_FULL_41_14]OFW95824.1 MAG: superoxide dismutase [Alphaproteobacteria bacterium RIFCSPLOWO2_01_FULL_45_8]HCI49120.1 superoxide dismutase [Fe] [Holosporales bacterium]
MTIKLPDLPYALDALAPYISERTLSIHHGKHHQAYVTNLNKLILGTDLEHKDLQTIIKTAHQNPRLTGVFNNAAQVWNHTFFWHSLHPHGGGKPPQEVLHLIEKSFSSFDHFKEKFKEAALTQFGSGWAWLVKEGATLKIVKTSNAETPLTDPSLTPLLTCDVWEHSYYLDYQNRRPDYVDTFLDHLMNWSFVLKNLE